MKVRLYFAILTVRCGELPYVLLKIELEYDYTLPTYLPGAVL